MHNIPVGYLKPDDFDDFPKGCRIGALVIIAIFLIGIVIGLLYTFDLIF